MKRWQLISNDSIWMFPPDIQLSTVELPKFIMEDGTDLYGASYESCIFFSDGNSDVVARYSTQEEAIAGHKELEKKYKLKPSNKLKVR